MSLLKKIYLFSPTFIQNIFISMYGIIRQHKRYGFNFKKRLLYFQKTNQFTNEEKNNYKINELKKLLKHASTSSYYKRIFTRCNIKWEDINNLDILCSLPLLTKEDLRQNNKKIFTKKISRYIRLKTSGSTGTPLKVKMGLNDFRNRMALLERMRNYYGVNYKDKHVTFVGKSIKRPNQKRFSRINYFGNQLVFSVYDINESSVEKIITEIIKFKPKFIEGYPSAFVSMALYLNKRKLCANFPLIFTTAETLLDEDRFLIKDTFNCSVIDYYGSNEGSLFITECKYGTKHLDFESGILEIIGFDNKEPRSNDLCKMIITSFSSKKMPLIRYDIGDLIVFEEGKCKCGKNEVMIKRIEGRTDDLLFTKEKGYIGRLSTSLKLLPSYVSKSQIVQKSLNDFDLNIEANQKLTENSLKPCIDDLTEKLGKVNIRVNLNTEFNLSGSGKFRSQVCLLNKRDKI